MVNRVKGREEKVIDTIGNFVRKTVDEAGLNGVVIGLSGGIDSSLTSTIASEYVDVKGLIMPSSFTSEQDIEDAVWVADNSDFEYEKFYIEDIVEKFAEKYEDRKDDKVAYGNLGVRTRAVLNYFVANTEERLVMGTGNRSEYLTGYYTKYGDQAVDINPIGHIYKTEVRYLADYLGIKDSIINKPPSAGMWDNQEDEDEMGISYNELDNILYDKYDKELSSEKLVDKYSKDKIRKISDLHNQSEHKRNMPMAPELLD